MNRSTLSRPGPARDPGRELSHPQADPVAAEATAEGLGNMRAAAEGMAAVVGRVAAEDRVAVVVVDRAAVAVVDKAAAVVDKVVPGRKQSRTPWR